MSKPVRLDEAAEDEFAEAAAWYQEAANLGGEFVQAVREAGARIGRRPLSFPLARGLSPHLSVRRCPVRRFPYALFFIEMPDELRVLAVAHERRRPGYWRGRVKAS